MKLFQKVIYKGTLECVTGLHIGDNKDSTDIGGVDLPVVRRKDNGQPYIPGSSLKGKMRCLLEQVAGENANGKSQNNGKEICTLFGASENKDLKLEGLPSRILVRDAYMTANSANFFKNASTTDMPYTEVKFENTISRITGVAANPRQQERVPAGAIFDIEFVINVFAEDEDKAPKVRQDFESILKRGVALLNDDYLGGSGSRGYGQIKLTLGEPTEKKSWHGNQ